jgi:hypothetical protein
MLPESDLHEFVEQALVPLEPAGSVLEPRPVPQVVSATDTERLIERRSTPIKQAGLEHPLKILVVCSVV